MDRVECAGRALARAFGYGCAWDTRHTSGADAWSPMGEAKPRGVRITGTLEDDDASAASDGLPVCRETETLHRAGDSVSAWLGKPDGDPRFLTPEQRRARAKLTPDERASLWDWERANPLTAGQQHNPRRPRELEHWKRTRAGAGVQVVRPLHDMDQCALEALAGISNPLQSILLLSALQDGRYWPTVELFARAVLPNHSHKGIPEGMYRMLTAPAKRSRAKSLGMRETDWDDMSRPALRLFESWLERAADAFLARLDKPLPTAGSQGNGQPSETWWRPPPVSADVRGGPSTSPRA